MSMLKPPKWTYPLAFITFVLMAAIAIIFRGTDDAKFQETILDLLDLLVPAIAGVGTGGAAVWSMSTLRDQDRHDEVKALAAELTWALALAAAWVIVGIAFMLGEALTTDIRDKLWGYLIPVVLFVVGNGVGAGLVGTLRGR